MRKWVRLDESQLIISAYEVDSDQVVDKEVFTDLSIQDLIGKVYQDANTITDAPKSLWNLQNEKVAALIETYNRFYQDYLKNYPDVEIQSFSVKQVEAAKVRLDNTLALTETPLLSGLVGNTSIEDRNTLAESILVKFDELVAMEKTVADTRARIFAATSESELSDIIW